MMMIFKWAKEKMMFGFDWLLVSKTVLKFLKVNL
eukprot:UN11319